MVGTFVLLLVRSYWNLSELWSASIEVCVCSCSGVWFPVWIWILSCLKEFALDEFQYVARYSCLDIAFAVHVPSHHLYYVTPTLKVYTHWVVRYLYITIDLGMVYRLDSNAECLIAFIDTSYAPDVMLATGSDGLSTSGCFVYYYGNLIDLCKQKIVARSIAAAELFAISDFIESLRVINHLTIEIDGNHKPSLYTKTLHQPEMHSLAVQTRTSLVDAHQGRRCHRWCKERRNRHPLYIRR